MGIGGYSIHTADHFQITASQFIRFFIVAVITLGMAVSPATQVVAKPAAAPTPSVSVSVPSAPFIGETLSISATFSNTVDTGYGPYMDLFLPLSGSDGTTGGANDGISIISANYLGAPVTTNILNCPAGSSVTHPLTGLSVVCPAQPAGLFSPFVWQMVVITMPFGSFVPGQPDATVTISAQLSNLADLNVGLPIQVRSGFMFGADPLDNPLSDPVIQSSIATVTPVPSPNLITLVKTYNGPEDETATGPNYPREYTVTATIAPEQTVTNLTLTDVLPNNMQFLTMVNPSNAACSILPSTSTPGGTITCPVTQVGNTASMTFRYFIPLNDSSSSPVINAISGDDVLSQNTASASGSWQPLDTRDTLTPVNVDPAGFEHILTDKSIAIQKGVANVTDSTNSPLDILRYTLNFQVSDYFAFQNISITDVISDGQHFYNAPGYAPTMSINGNQYSLGSAALDADYVDVSCNYTGGPGSECDTDNPAANDGTTSILFEISPEIIRRGQDGRMVGGCVPNTGVGSGNFPSCNLYNDGATTGTITFYTQILENFTDTYPSGDPSVDQGDTLGNSVSIVGDLLTVTDAATPTGENEADGSGASVSIPYGEISKAIYAINGSTSFSPPVSVSPGDAITYRVTYTLPTSDFEALALTDYLPLPVFDSTTVTTFNPSVCGVPASGTSCYGPTDSYHALPNTPTPVVPTLTTSSATNSVTWTYGNYDANNNQPSKIDLLFTVTVNNLPFADGLFLTNQAHVQENSTNAGDHKADGIVQILLQEPVVNIKKGVVWTDKTGVSYAPATPGPVSFTNSGCPAFSGTVNSTNLAATPINSDLAGVDADDTVKMAIVLENTGRNAAYDLLVRDAIPAGLTFVPGSVCVTDGAGNALAFTGAANSLVSSGITLTSLSRGKLSDGTTVATGTNIAIVTYNVTVDANAVASQAYTNTATLASYAGQPGGPNHIPGGRTDTATVTPAPPAIAKTFVSSEINDAYNSNTQVVIGEYASYQVVVTVPEGVTQNAQIVDTLDAGLAYVDLTSATLSTGLSISGSTTPVITNNGQTVTFSLGTVTNTNTDDAVAETITLVYRVVTLNVAGNQSGTLLNNSAALSWTGGSASASAANVTVIEPTVNTSKSVSGSPFDAGNTATFTITLTNPAANSTSAHDVTWSDTIPSGLTYVAGSLALGTCTAATAPSITFSAPASLSGSGGLFQPGQSCQITFQATINYTSAPGQTITNIAETRWTSMAGTISGRSAYNANAYERDGTGGLLGGGQLNDYRTQGSVNVVISSVVLQKYIVATSEAHTTLVAGTEQVTVGEIVRYRLRVQLPEGTSTNFQVQDRLPTGMIFLNDGTAKAAFVSNGTGISSSAVGTLPVPAISDTDCYLSGNAVNATTPAIPAACAPLADYNIGSSNSTSANADSYSTGTDPYFKLGTLVNNDSDSDAEFVIVEFNALVDNTSAGSNDAGDLLGNDFRVFINGSQNNGTAALVNVRVAEPVLTINKSITGTTPVDAGDPVNYRLVITNSNSGTPATAFDIVMTDTINSNLTINSASITGTTQGATCQGGTASSQSITTVGQLITVNATCLDVNQTITVDISATVNADAPSSLTIPNTGRITWTSLPGSNGTTSNPTGSANTGTPGSDTGERTGDTSGGTRSWNDYAAQSLVSFSLANPVSVVKNAPTPLTYTIGQTITYPIVVTLHEGITQSLRVTDTLPQGLAYLSYIVDTTGFTGTVTTSPTVGTVGDPVTGSSTTTFTFGNPTVTATAASGTSAFTINVTARVLDISQNQIGNTKTNSATAIYVDPDTSSDVTMNGGTQTITITEPRIATTKDVSPLTGVDAGDIVTYTVRFTNTGTSTAYEVTALDVLTQGVTYNNGSISCVDNTSAVVPVTLTNNNSTLGFDGSPAGAWDIPVNGYIQCTYTVTAGSGIYLDGTHTNTIDADWTGLDGSDPFERTYTDVVSRTVDGTQDTDDAVFSSPSVTIQKSVDPASATIGENLTFTLTINGANGLLRSLVLTDRLPAGLIFNNDTVVTGLSGLLAPTVSSPNDGSALVTITWPAADVTKTTDSATLVFTARVADVAGNHWATPPMTVTNTFLLDHQTAEGAAAAQLSATAAPAIVEPRIQTTKTVSPTSGVQAGDTLTYTVVFTNTGSSTAFDVTAHDVLAQGVSYVPASASCLPATVAVTDYGSSLDLSGASGSPWDIAAGSSITCTYDVTADADLYLDGVHTNTIDADWTSLAGSSANERVYNDTVSRVVDGTQDTDDASFTASGINFSKSVDKSSATIGEVVTYTLTITGPNGLLRDLSITDNLDAGWIFNNDTVFTGLSVSPTPTYGTNDGSAPVTVTWNFGDVEKSTEPATLVYSVTVANETATTTGDTMGNSASLTYHRADGSTAGPLTDSTSTGIVEPDLNLVKSIVSPPSNSIGSPVSYSLLLNHTSVSTADAYDVVISDTVPTTYLDFTTADNTALTITFTPAACASAINNSTPATDTVSISIAHLPIGCQAEVTFTARLKQEITPGLLVSNSAGVGYSTLSGTPVEERSYTDNDSVSFTTSDPDIEKVLDSSDVTQTTDPNLTIGETATYKVTVHIPEGTTNTLQVIDTLPASMAYISGSAVVATTTDRTGTTIPVPAITEDGANHRVTFDFTGPIIITDSDPATEDDTFTITLQAVVLNDVNNQMGGTLTNRVTVQADGGAILSDTADISLVEPDLNITKSVDNNAPTPDEEITFTLDLAHTTISGSDAFDVVIEDTMPDGLDFVAGSATMPAGWNFALNGKVVTFTGDLSLTAGSAQFTYKAEVNNATPILTDLTNTAATTWTSMPGTSPEERTGADGSGGALNDYADQDNQTVTFHGVELVITKADSPTTITPSIPATPTTPAVPSVLRYTISYSNTGDIDATNVVITETVPQFTRFNKLTSTGGDTLPPTGWDCADLSAAGTTCHFNIATVAAGASGTLYFDVVIDETVPADTTQILNSVSIKADEKEPVYTNNTDDEDTPLTAAPDMAITKTDGVSIISSGIELTYTLTVRNNGNEGATGVVVTDTLPYHVTYVDGSATPAFTSMTTVPAPIPTDPDQTVLTWNVAGEVAAGAELTFTYRVRVEDPMPAGVTEIVNSAAVADDGTNGEDPTPEDNTSTDTDYLATLPNTNLSKIVAGTSEPSTLLDNVAIGESLLYRVTFVLPPGDLPSMTLSDSLPLGLAFGECVSITSSSQLVTNNLANQFDTTCSTPIITAEPLTSLEPANQGRNVLFNFGDVTNAGTGNALLTLDYTVYVLDNALNIRDVDMVNLIHWKWGADNDLQTESTPVTIVEPTLSIGKIVDPTSGIAGTIATYTLTVAHTGDSNATAFDVLVQDTLPKGMDYIPGTLQVLSGPAPDLLEELGAPLLQIGWDALPARDALNNPTTVVIEYQARINNAAGPGTTLINDANVAWSSLPGDLSAPQTPNNLLSTERFYDPGDAVNIYGVRTAAEFSIPKLDVAPATGFAPGVVTDISGIPQTQASDLGSIMLDIPSLGIKLPVVGIPATKNGWDLTWLGKQAGWLEGSAYPTWEGNTAITAHVYLPDGKPGPFVNLKNLRWGNRFYILANGMRYTYEVRITARVRPDDETIMAHEKLDWVTLITCAGYDETTGTYKWRDIVKAVLIKVEDE